jgi:hypothetical protein
MATGLAAVIYGIGVLTGAWGDNRFFRAQALVEAGLLLPLGVFTALVIPRRRRRLAQTYLATTEPATPRV